MAELKPEDWEELDETINREKELYTESDLEAARQEERESVRDMDVSIIRSMIEGAREEAFSNSGIYIEALEEYADNIGCLMAIRKMVEDV